MTWNPPDDFAEPFAVTVTYDPDDVDDGQRFVAAITANGGRVQELMSLADRSASRPRRGHD